MKTLTTTNKTPIFVTNKHYQIAGTTNASRVYDLIYNETLGRWICDCPDATENHNPNCKHRRKLVEHIKAQMAARVQQEATAVAEQPSEIEVLSELVCTLQEQVQQLQSHLEQMESKMNHRECYLLGRVQELQYKVEQLQETKAEKAAVRNRDHLIHARIDNLEATKANKRVSKPRAAKKVQQQTESGEQSPDTTEARPSFAEALLHKAQQQTQAAASATIGEEEDSFERIGKIELTQEEMAEACELLGIPAPETVPARELAPLSSNRGFSMLRQ